ncbi:hypothetical protein HK101_003787 [Irineochytrium annulatum]|nr:hypothetical protein HK101_003787 [Irineochytrium annulatum]
MLIAEAAYPELLAQYKNRLLPQTDPVYQQCAKVALDIISVVGVDLREWDLHVIDDESTMNAFVISSGKIFVFTGILKICETPDALAAILSHELAHVLSRHIGEQIGVSHVFQLIQELLHSILYTLTLNLPMIADVTGRTLDATSPFLTVQPYSRMCESEADVVGLFLMSIAGYNPEAAVGLWRRFGEMEGADEMPEILSDHPSHERRAEELQEHLASALAIYRARGMIAAEFKKEAEARRKYPEGLPSNTEGVLTTTENGMAGRISMEDIDRSLYKVLADNLKDKQLWFAGGDGSMGTARERVKAVTDRKEGAFFGAFDPTYYKNRVLSFYIKR